jgi:flagellar hook-length control protein FliK
MNDLIQLIHAITSDMLQTNNGMDTEVNEYSQSLQAQQARLEEQRKILSSNEASMKLNKQMVRYTEEKARYTDNLLKLYGFLNVVTLGLLLYVYKAAGDA